MITSDIFLLLFFRLHFVYFLITFKYNNYMSIFSFFKRLFNKPKKKIGLALGSGGAKGIAHVGALKAFEEEGISFDMVAGTSIGSIAGALYALGYTSDEMLKIMEEYNFSSRISVLKMAIGKDSLENTLDSLLGGKTFSDTLLPFRAVACDVNSGEEVVMDSGSLSKALSASSAVPPVFRPVYLEGRKLVDGAFVNAVPADVVKNLGADVVIALSLHDYSSNENLKKYADVLYPNNGIKKANRLENIKYADYAVYFPLDKYGSASVTDYREIYNIGYETAKSHMAEIKKVIKDKKVCKRLF